ncbi:MAG: wax ester/triacylglycerol synthase family O-acyltransferase [Dehalococcoidia bacterium]
MTSELRKHASNNSSSPPLTPAAPRELNRRLGLEDTAFLFLESDESPSNVGSVAIFEGNMSFDRFLENVSSKMHLVPRYRQRVVGAPFNAARPTWEDDPDFDIRRHIRRLRLDAPGTLDDLMNLAARIHEGKMDRSKPLWEIYIVEGLEGDRTGMINKVHHCLVDGIAGIELLMITLDFSPEPAPAPPPERDYSPAPIPSWRTLLRDAIFDQTSEVIDRWADFQQSLVDLVSGEGSRWKAIRSAVGLAIPYFSVPAEPMPLNGKLSGKRKLATTAISFKEVREIRKAVGGTVNDVVLTALAGALSRYIESHGESTAGRSVRVVTPVNVRSDGEAGLLGNNISMLIVETPVGIDDPIERLAEISQRTTRLKESRAAEGVRAISDALLSAPPPVIAALGRAGVGINNLGNLVCTNVPGPMIPLYAVGHRMLAHYPIAPIVFDMGANVAVMSYDGMLYFGLVADRNAADDVHVLRDFLDEAYAELRDAAGVGTHPPIEIIRPTEAVTDNVDALARAGNRTNG